MASSAHAGLAGTLVKNRPPAYRSRVPPRPATSVRRHRRLRPLNPVPATPYVEQLSIGAWRRLFAIGLAVLIPALLLLLLLTTGLGSLPDKQQERITMVSLEAAEVAEQAPESASKAREQQKEAPTPPVTSPPVPAPPPTPLPPQVPQPATPPQPPAPPATPPTKRIGVRLNSGQSYGPADSGGSAASRDTPRVGSAPNGEPLYAAAWYREPSRDELRGYLSTAGGPGWGLIACRTAPEFRVEDCVGLDEYPQGSQINRAVLAAAWQFRVRPPRVGGRSMVGAWVRIRIDYGIERP